MVFGKGRYVLSDVDQIFETPRERALQAIRQCVSEKLTNISAQVYLIGSCARGDYRRESDIDIAVELLEPTQKTLISDIRDALEQSDIPFVVDVFDYSQLDEAYRAEIQKEGVLWVAPTQD